MLRPKKITLVSVNVSNEKNLHPGDRKLFFLINTNEFYWLSICHYGFKIRSQTWTYHRRSQNLQPTSFFSLFLFLFVCVCVYAFLFFEIKIIYSDTISTMWEGNYQKKKKKTLGRFPETRLFFGLSSTLRLNFFYLRTIHILHSRYSPEIMGHILKNKQNNKYVCIHEIIVF